MSFLNSSVTVQEGNEDKQISTTDKRVTEQKTRVNVTDNSPHSNVAIAIDDSCS